MRRPYIVPLPPVLIKWDNRPPNLLATLGTQKRRPTNSLSTPWFLGRAIVPSFQLLETLKGVLPTPLRAVSRESRRLILHFIEDPQGIPSIHFLTVSRECRRLILITNYYYSSRNYYCQGSGVITCAPHLLIYAYSYEFTDTFLMCFTHHTSHNSITFTPSKVGTPKTCLILYK